MRSAERQRHREVGYKVFSATMAISVLGALATTCIKSILDYQHNDHANLTRNTMLGITVLLAGCLLATCTGVMTERALNRRAGLPDLRFRLLDHTVTVVPDEEQARTPASSPQSQPYMPPQHSTT